MNHLTIALPAALFSAPALAHPGSHHDVPGWQEAVVHLLGSPFHAGLLAGAVLCAGAGLVLLNRGFAAREKSRVFRERA